MKKLILSILFLSISAYAAVNLGACKGCHGQNWEKKALGKSKVVADMTKNEVSAALVGYKNKTYGGPMKKLMTNQVKKYSEQDLNTTGLGKEPKFKDTVKSNTIKGINYTKNKELSINGIIVFTSDDKKSCLVAGNDIFILNDCDKFFD